MSGDAALVEEDGSHPSLTRTVAAAAAVVLAGSALLAALVIGRRTWFYADDWNAFDLYAGGDVLAPFNGHLSVLPATIFTSLYRGVGVGSYLPFRVMSLVALGVLGWMLFRYASTRVGAGWAVALVGAVLWSSSGASNLLFPFLVNFTLPLLATVAMWWNLDRDDAAHDRWASLWLAVALASSGLGLMALLAAAVELVARRSPWRRWAVLAPGPLLWAVWFAFNRTASELADDPAAVARYAAEMALGALTALAGGWAPGALLVGALLSAVVGWRLCVGDVDGPRVLAAASAPLAFVVLTALTRSQTEPSIPPDELRYAWTVSLYLLLVLVALRRPGPRGEADEPQPARVTGLLAVGVAGWIALNATVALGAMQDWSDMVADAAPGLRSNLYAVEAVGPGRIDPERVLPLSFEFVTAQGYLDAVAAVGSPIAGVTPSELGGEAFLRVAADRLLIEELPVSIEPTSREQTPTSCVAAVATTAVPPGATLVVDGEPGEAVALARFADDADAVLLAHLGDGPLVVRIPPDAPTGTRARVPYRLVLGSTSSARSCS